MEDDFLICFRFLRFLCTRELSGFSSTGGPRTPFRYHNRLERFSRINSVADAQTSTDEIHLDDFCSWRIFPYSKNFLLFSPLCSAHLQLLFVHFPLMPTLTFSLEREICKVTSVTLTTADSRFIPNWTTKESPSAWGNGEFGVWGKFPRQMRWEICSSVKLRRYGFFVEGVNMHVFPLDHVSSSRPSSQSRHYYIQIKFSSRWNE